MPRGLTLRERERRVLLAGDTPGVLYADRRFEQARFEQVYVCFGGGHGVARVCFAARA